MNRRQAAVLGAAVVSGWAVGQVLRVTAHIGRDIGTAAEPILAGGGSPEDGPADASLRVAVFTDYRCPACRHAFPSMEDAVRRDGRVRVVYKDWPIFGPQSERAAIVAIGCDEQGIYPAIHRRLMTDSRQINDGMLQDVVASAGGNWSRLAAWLAKHQGIVEAQLRANAREAYSIGLTGTPGFLAGPMLVMGAIGGSEFDRLFTRARDANRGGG